LDFPEFGMGSKQKLSNFFIQYKVLS